MFASQVPYGDAQSNLSTWIPDKLLEAWPVLADIDVDAWVFWTGAVILAIIFILPYSWSFIRKRKHVVAEKRVVDLPIPLTRAEIEARQRVGNVVSGKLMNAFREHPKTEDDPENIAAHGLIDSLIPNLDHRGAIETLEFLDKLRIKAGDAFGEVENSFHKNRHYDSILREEPALANIKEEWFAAFNAVVSDIRDLPENLNRDQMQKFIGSDAATWKSENERAIKWAEGFLKGA